MEMTNLMGRPREIPIRPENKVKSIQKQKDGSLSFTLASGETGVLSAGDPTIQQFIVYSVLAEL